MGRGCSRSLLIVYKIRFHRKFVPRKELIFTILSERTIHESSLSILQLTIANDYHQSGTTRRKALETRRQAFRMNGQTSYRDCSAASIVDNLSFCGRYCTHWPHCHEAIVHTRKIDSLRWTSRLKSRFIVPKIYTRYNDKATNPLNYAPKRFIFSSLR